MSENKHAFGENCPKGMVQVEFVGVSPALRRGDYGWNPSESAFIEVWVDGFRYRIDVGNVTRSDGTKERGLHICGPIDMTVDRHSLNAVDIFHTNNKRS